MKAGDVTRDQTSSRESWLSAPLSDPNAALWASITPPANPNIATLVRRRAAAFSLDLLAQRLHLRSPALFASRATARVAILSAAVAAGAALGAAGFLMLKAHLAAPAAASAPLAVGTPSAGGAARAAASQTAALEAQSPMASVRQGRTELSDVAEGAATRVAPAALAPAAAGEREPEPIARPLRQAAAAADETRPSAPAKAKRGARKRDKLSARRASRRRARAALD